MILDSEAAFYNPEEFERTLIDWILDKNDQQLNRFINSGIHPSIILDVFCHHWMKSEYRVRGISPLMVASFQGYELIVDLFLYEGRTDINAKSVDGYTALMLATNKGYLNVMKHLVYKGAKVNFQNAQGLTALMFAANRGCKESVKFLIDAGAILDLKNRDGYTAGAIALLRGFSEDLVSLFHVKEPVNNL